MSRVLSSLLLLFSLCALLSACAAPPVAVTSTGPAPTTAPVAVTQLMAELTGTLQIENGCIRVQGSNDKGSILLVWPPDLSATIQGNSVHVVSGLVSGIHEEFVLQAGQSVDLGGGTFSDVNQQLKSTEAGGCPGPYWVVSEVGSP